jgi:hypothetical protein
MCGETRVKWLRVDLAALFALIWLVLMCIVPKTPPQAPIPHLPKLSFEEENAQKIVGFIHIATIGQWKLIAKDMLNTTMNSQLFGMKNTRMFVNLIGEDYLTQILPTHEKLNYIRSSRIALVGEEATLNLLRDYCYENPTSIVWYGHSKGTRRSSSFGEQWDWRKYMEYYVIEKGHQCVEHLQSGEYDTCGASFSRKPSKHYSGNFWMARCDYVNTLPNFLDFYWSWPFNGYLYVELWIGKNLNPKRAFNCHDTTRGRPHYSTRFPRSSTL